jgi:putative inorganic carbon (HCO3(-)) transporter
LLLPALVLLMLFWPLRRLAYGRWTRRSPADLGILALAILGVLTLWVSPLPAKSLPQVYRLLVGIGFYYAVVNSIRRRAHLKAAILAVLLAALGLSAFALISVDWTQTKLPFLPPAIYERFLLLVADSVHPNVLAGTLVILLAGLSALPLWGWRRLPVGSYALLLILLAGVLGLLVLSQSRGSLIALGAALLVLAALRWRWGWTLSVLAGAAAVALFGWIGSQTVLDSIFAGASLDGLDGRFEIWARAVYMIQDFPFTGVGLGLYGQAADLLYPFFRLEAAPVAHAHNLFLQIGADLGLPGLIAWLSVHLLVFAAGWNIFLRGRALDSALFSGLGAGVLAFQAALTVHGLFDAVTWGMVRPAPLVWGIWGLAFAGWRFSRSTRV